MRRGENVLHQRWQAAPETTIGGWCVQPEGEPPTHDGGIEIACFCDEAAARHIADLHNSVLGEAEGE